MLIFETGIHSVAHAGFVLDSPPSFSNAGDSRHIPTYLTFKNSLILMGMKLLYMVSLYVKSVLCVHHSKHGQVRGQQLTDIYSLLPLHGFQEIISGFQV